MIGISVAVGRFVETLIWAIIRVAGVVAGWAMLGLVVLAVGFFVGRRVLRWHRAR